MQSKLAVALGALLGIVGLLLIGTANGCGTAAPGKCCLFACPLFSPCALTKPCPIVPPPTQPPPPPGPDPLVILEQIFDGIANIFKSVEALLPAGSPVLNILDNVFAGVANIFATVESTLQQGGRRKRDADDECVKPKGYGFAKKKFEGKLGHKSALAATEAQQAAEGFSEEAGNEISKLVVEGTRKSAVERKKAFREAMKKHGEQKDKVEKVLDAHSKTLEDTKETTAKYLDKKSPEAKEAGQKLISILLDEKLTPEEKEKQVDEHYAKIKPEVVKELGLKHIAFIKRAAAVASSPFATLGSYRIPLKLEF